MRFLLLFIMVLAISSCSSGDRDSSQEGLLTPLPGKVEEPDNEALKHALQNYLGKSGAPLASRYEFNRIDLNGDRRRDAIVLLKSPFGYWCDDYGCTMLVFKAHEKHFTFVSKTAPLREPVYIADSQHHGWKDLVVRVSGRWTTAKDVAMTFNGNGYPADPSKLPSYFNRNKNAETRIFR